jgi:hypothetical protein
MVSLSVVVRKRTLITRMFTCVDCSCIDNNIIYILLWLTKQTSGSRMSFIYGALVTSGQLVVWRSSDLISLGHFRGLTSPGEHGSGYAGLVNWVTTWSCISDH